MFLEAIMHETALTQNLINIACKALEGRGIKKVNSITVCVGALSGVLYDAMEFAFEAMKRDTVLETATLVFEGLPVRAKCRECAAEYQPVGFPYICPECAGRYFEIIEGEEVYIKNIDCIGDDDVVTD